MKGILRILKPREEDLANPEPNETQTLVANLTSLEMTSSPPLRGGVSNLWVSGVSPLERV
jgi:hypothetical protein